MFDGSALNVAIDVYDESCYAWVAVVGASVTVASHIVAERNYSRFD